MAHRPVLRPRPQTGPQAELKLEAQRFPGATSDDANSELEVVALGAAFDEALQAPELRGFGPRHSEGCRWSYRESFSAESDSGWASVGGCNRRGAATSTAASSAAASAAMQPPADGGGDCWFRPVRAPDRAPQAPPRPECLHEACKHSALGSGDEQTRHRRDAGALLWRQQAYPALRDQRQGWLPSPLLEPLGSPTAFAVGGPEAVVLDVRRFSGEGDVDRHDEPTRAIVRGHESTNSVGLRPGTASVSGSLHCRALVKGRLR
jgi:hypothetical protein